MKRRPAPVPHRAKPCADFCASASAGFTRLELAAVIFIMGLMLTLALPYLGGFRQAAPKSQARRMAGRATYLFHEPTGHKLVLRLLFDMDPQAHPGGPLHPYAVTAGVPPTTRTRAHP